MATSKKPAAAASAAPAAPIVTKASVAKKAPAAKKAVLKTAAAKTPAAAKPVPKAAAPAPKAAPKAPAKAAAKKAVQSKPVVQGPSVDAAQRANYIEVAAYYIAQRRGFTPGDAQQDYLDAAAEIDQLIAAGHFSK